MTPYSHGFYTLNISMYQMRGNSRRKPKAFLTLPKRKGNQKTKRLQPRSLLQAAGTEQASHRATLTLPKRRQCLLSVKASTEAWQKQTKVCFIRLQNSQVSPAPFWEQGGFENFNIYFQWWNCLLRQTTKRKPEKAFASSRSPFSKAMDITKYISFSSRDRLKLDFLYPYVHQSHWQKVMPARKWPDNPLQLNRKPTHFSGHDADAQCRLCPLPQYLHYLLPQNKIK